MPHGRARDRRNDAGIYAFDERALRASSAANRQERARRTLPTDTVSLLVAASYRVVRCWRSTIAWYSASTTGRS